MTNQEPQILDYQTFDYNRLEYYDPLQTKGGSYVSNINYLLDDNKSIPIYIQSPRLKVTNGVVETTRKTYIELELDSSDKSNLEFYNFLMKFDEINLRTCHRKSKQWFGQQFPLDDIDKSYDGPIKANRGRSPSIKLNLQTIRGNLITEIYNDRKQQTNADYIVGGDYVVAIIEIDGLKFGKSRFLFDMSVSQLKVYKEEVKGKLTGYHIQDNTNQVNFYPGQGTDDEFVSDAEEVPQSNDVRQSYDTQYNDPDIVSDVEDHSEPVQEPVIEPLPEPEEEQQPEDELEQHHDEEEQQPEDDLEQQHDEEEEHQTELQQHDEEEQYQSEPEPEEQSEEQEVENGEIDVEYTPETKPLPQPESIEILDDLIPGELSTVNFGINSDQYLEQVNEMRDNVRNLMNELELYKEEYQQNIKDFHKTIDERREKYRELCHRYNTIPEF